MSSEAEVAELQMRIGHLERAMEARTVIGQAQGILMERHHLNAVQAFELLCATSQHSNRKLRDVAEELARTGEEAPIEVAAG